MKRVELFYVLSMEYPRFFADRKEVGWVQETFHGVRDIEPGEKRDEIYEDILERLVSFGDIDTQYGEPRVLFFSLEPNVLLPGTAVRDQEDDGGKDPMEAAELINDLVDEHPEYTPEVRSALLLARGVVERWAQS